MKKKLKRLQAIMLISIAIISVIISLCSCEEHDDSCDNKQKVGNILLTNNTIITPNNFNSSKDQAMGVIFYVNKDTTLIVGTKECGEYCYADSLKKIDNIQNDIYSKCGMENTAAILSSGVNSPAAMITETYKNIGWYLPSAGELKALSNNIDKVTNSMNLIGGDRFTDDFYVSSSQDGTSEANAMRNYYSVAVKHNIIISCSKTTAHKVRSITRVM